jgi:hypothetical protein
MFRIVAWSFACASLSMQAVAADTPAAPPTSAAPRTPPAYVSALAGYRAWREVEVVPWKRANDEVGRLGGHAGHLRGSSPTPPAPVSGGAGPAEKR